MSTQWQRFLLLFFTPLLLIRAGSVYGNSIDTTDKRIADYRKSVVIHRNTIRFIEYTLQLNGIPRALRNLAMIESDFDNTTLSCANAAGIWQITPDVATDYGLHMNPANDERYDVYKSTWMACRNLLDLYKQYQNWITVIAAYNCGAGRVSRAMALAHSNQYADFYRYLPDETIMHVYKFMMACYATGEAGFAIQTPATNAPETAFISISAGYKLAVIASQLQLPFQKLEQLNPAFEKELLEQGVTRLQLPVDKMPDFLLIQNQILKTSLETE